jgi:hypothetical protein
MKKSEDLRLRLGDSWIPTIYEQRVRKLRTRTAFLPVAPKLNSAEILFTLLGIELKVGKRRFPCPDLATARYLQVFARLGCPEVAIPYDITQISPLADEFEVGWQRMLLVVDEITKGASGAAGSRLLSIAAKEVREAVKTIGSGRVMPDFPESTLQRRP